VAVIALAPLAALGCGGERAREERAQAERKELARTESTAVQAIAALPATGLWTEAHVLERLLRAGVAPRKVDGATDAAPWMQRKAIVFAAGGGEVHAWIYRDSTSRRAVTDGLDAETGTPRGMVPPFAAPMVFIMQNNLAAVVTGGSETNQERIALALQAGLPVKP